ncbi:carbohydrate ABC transporter permease [Promicromonospora thailandica]|uniref:Raffinose/stachyose/melibiose transport system permease protein n=1 Tax=Promicromonospora thailandica TaxID=765201 RepID=A0A9X2JU84_9MICO|nr:sugar ABC transporter permease [Promicromonospora thailandica]MCP2263746.1 raffinose/stachyose/melibiose transport system permease protein [Promicromonospora thailandica]BFF17969.1 sugar ABC transporter permease [Promicromonospora thailandica]
MSRRRTAALPTPVALLFLLPAAALFAVFVLYPMATALTYSLFSWRGTAQEEFVGAANFVALFTTEPYRSQLPRAFGHNALLFAGAMVAQNTVGLLLAYVLHQRARFRRLFQVLFTMPYLVSPLVVGYLWSLLLSPLFGPVNALLRAVGLDAVAQPWLGDPDTALWVVVLVTAWQWVGFPLLVYGAALGALDPSTQEAAMLDGASSAQRFWHVTLPLLTPVIGTVSVLTFIFSMEAFPIPYALGGSSGSPAGATDVMSLLFYRTAFHSGASNAIGVSSAVAIVLFLVIVGVSVAFTRWFRGVERRLT